MKSTHKLIGFALATSLLMGGCSPVDTAIAKTDSFAQEKLSTISVPFEWFKKDEQVSQEVVDWSEVPELALSNKDASLKELEKEQSLIENLQKEVTSEVKLNGFLSRTRHSHESFAGFASTDDTKDVFGDILRQVYDKPHQSVQSLTLTGMGQYMKDSAKKALFVSVNVVNDSEKFLVYPLLLTLDKDGNIESVNQVQKESEWASTPTPLTAKSEFHESVHQEFKFVWNDFLMYPKTEEYATVTTDDFTSWLTTNDVEERKKSAKTVHSWFQENEGDLSRAEITGYVHTDEKASGITKYEVAYPVKNSTVQKAFTINYDRGLNKIISIESGSPFGVLQEGETK